MDVEQDVHKNYNGSSHGTKLMKSTLGLASTILLPCAGGTDLKSGQSERQMDFRNQQDFMEFRNQQDFKIERDRRARTLLMDFRNQQDFMEFRNQQDFKIQRDRRARTLLMDFRNQQDFMEFRNQQDFKIQRHRRARTLLKIQRDRRARTLLMDFRNQQDFMEFRNQQDFKIQRHRRARTLLFIHFAGSSGADANSREMDVEQDVHKNYNGSSHGTKLMKSTLGLASTILLPCAGGTDLKSGQPERQDHSEIYPSTLRHLSNCPSPMEYMNKTLEKCADACGSYLQDGNCAYHCMRDSSKTGLVEFCAKPKKLFVYCPEYDPVDQTIQKDLSTLCNSKDYGSHYNSSDIYFCDPANCLQLHESSVRSGATTLTTLMNETTETNSGQIPEWYIFLFVVALALILAIVLGCVSYVSFQRGFFSARTRKVTKKRNLNGLTYQNAGRKIPSEI